MITQLFYDNDLFYQFKEKLDLVGIEQLSSQGYCRS